MGALPSQKYDDVCIELLKYFFRTRCEYVDDYEDENGEIVAVYSFEQIDIERFVIEYLVKCDNLEIEVR